MPELPEVAATVAAIAGVEGHVLIGQTLPQGRQRQVQLQDPSVALGARWGAPTRRGKYVLCPWTTETGEGFGLIVHLGMSGQLKWCPAGTPLPERHVRASWTLDGGTLAFVDPRRFGRVHLIEGPPQGLAKLASLGPDADSEALTLPLFRATLRRSRAAIKRLLLDQRALAGVGNIYADESLFRAKIHPLTVASQISNPKSLALHRHLQLVLREAIQRKGTSFDQHFEGGAMQGHLQAYGRRGLPCVRCEQAMKFMRVSMRGTHFCSRCQRRRGGG